MSREQSLVFSVYTDEEFDEEGGVVVKEDCIFFSGRGQRSWIHTAPTVGVGVTVRVVQCVVVCYEMVGLIVQGDGSLWFILHSLFALCMQGYRRQLGEIRVSC